MSWVLKLFPSTIYVQLKVSLCDYVAISNVPVLVCQAITLAVRFLNLKYSYGGREGFWWHAGQLLAIMQHG